MPTDISLDSHQEAFIREQIGSGRYSDASGVVSEGLRLLETREQQRGLQIEALRTDLAAGRASGNPEPADTVFDQLEADLEARKR